MMQNFKCPSCDGAIEFNSTVQKMKCPYCDTEFEVADILAYNEATADAPDGDDMQWDSSAGGEWQEGETEGMRVFTCSSCGGQIVGDENTGATECPFCSNPVVLTGAFRGDLKPDLVIPFKLDKKAAMEALRKHYQGKKLLPPVFKDENRIKEVKGVYVPFWLYSSDAKGYARFKATRVRTWSDSDYNYVETRYYNVVRAGEIGFDFVPVDGSSKMDDALMEAIEPFDLSQAVDFQTAYLAGYFADKYDVDSATGVLRANERIKASTSQALADTVHGYASVHLSDLSVDLKNGTAKYALVPVWLLNTRWKDKNYVFAMNGQTGKMVGDLPMDKGLFWKWFLGTSAGICGAIFALMSLLWLF
ncbi:MAG: IBR domain-containing protein [Clostridia bacterium]|nr:IBR domain-containing protein [Clostridia bacterium]